MVVSDLNEGEYSFRRLAENLPGIVYRVLIEEDNRMIFFNDMVQTMTGYRPEDLKRGEVCSIDPIIVPEDKLNVINIVKDAIENNVPFEVEYRINNKIGDIKWFFERGRPIRGDNGNPSYIDGVIFDITKQKDVEKRLSYLVRKRTKKLECLYNLSKILEEKKITKESIIKRVVNLLPPAWQFPDVTCARIQVDNKECETANFMKTKWNQSSEIFVNDKKVGFVEVFYLEEMPSFDEGPFLKEERNLLNEIVERLGRIFERLDRELILEESEKKHKLLSQELELILDHIVGPVFYKDTKNRFIWVNKYIADAYKMKREDLIGKSLFELNPRDQAQAYWDDDLEVINSGKPKLNIEEPWETDDGLKWVLTSKIPNIDENGDITGIIGTSVDITDRAIAEQKLIESEKKYRDLANLLPQVICETDAQGNLTFVNQNAYNVFGYTQDDFDRGLNALQMIIPKDRERTWRNIKKILNGEEIDDVEYMALRKDGSVFPIIAYATPIIQVNKSVGLRIVLIDASDLKKIEEKLKESEKKYRYLIENSLEGVWVIDSNANTILINPSMAKMLGYTIEEMIGKSLFLFMNEEEIEITKRNLERRKKGISEERDFALTHKNGKKVYLRIRASPIFDVEGNYEGTFAFLNNITQRKLTEQNLIESEEKSRKQNIFLNNILESLTHPFYVVNVKDYTIALANSTASFEGLEREKYCYSLTHNNNKPCEAPCICPLNEVKKTKRTCVVKHIHYDREGNEKTYEIYGYPILDESGNVVQMIEYTLNISDRKKAEQKLIESEEKFRTIAERTLMGILIIQDNQIKYVNDALLNMFEYSQNEIADWERDDLTKLIHSEDLLFFREYREHLRRGDKSFKPYYSYRVLTKSGKMKWIDQFSKEILYRGRSAELITIMDITEKKEVEHELIKLNNMKSELLRRTSHELRTPLVSIKGFSDLLLELHRDKLDDYVIKTINQIRGGCSRLEALVNDILKTAELESGTVQLEKSKGDLSLLIKLCVSELEGLSELRNHTINLDIPDKLICTFEKEQIYNVITNILSNAIMFTPPSGKIEVKSEINNDFIIISIKDNGIGFTEEERSLIFKQFGKIERYGQGYDVISEGSGLGLYISKKIVELHGGEIWFESEGRNKGSTFIVSLPMDGN